MVVNRPRRASLGIQSHGILPLLEQNEGCLSHKTTTLKLRHLGPHFFNLIIFKCQNIAKIGCKKVKKYTNDKTKYIEKKYH